VTPVIELVYSRRDFFGEGLVRGGYYAWLAGFSEQGRGADVEEALEDLCRRLREEVVAWDGEADVYERARVELDKVNQHREPVAIAWARDELRTGTLLDAIRRQACEPVLDADDDPRLHRC
jgi:hypothetical protein